MNHNPSIAHAVITGSQLLYSVITPAGQKRLVNKAITCPQDIPQLIALAQAHGIVNFWVAPGSELSHVSVDFCELPGESPYNVRFRTRKESKLRKTPPRVRRITIWPKKGNFTHTSANIRVTFPEWEWLWQEREPVSVLAGVSYLAQNIPNIEQGPAMAGRALMSELVPAEWRELIECDLSQAYKNAGGDLEYHRELTPEEIAQALAQGWYIIACDKNSMYLGAASSAMLGSGTPDYIPQEIARTYTPNMRLPGLWHIRIQEIAPLFNGRDLPCLFNNREITQGETWVSTSLLRVALDLGYKIELLEGYQWAKEHSHRALEKWALRVWGVRLELRQNTKEYFHPQGRALALQGTKKVAVDGLGLLRSEEHTLRYAPEWFHPQMWQGVLDLAKERMIYKIKTLYEKRGVRVVGVDTDCIFLLSQEPVPPPEVNIDPTQLGAFKIKYCLPLTQELASEINASTSGAGIERVLRNASERGAA